MLIAQTVHLISSVSSILAFYLDGSHVQWQRDDSLTSFM